VKKRAFLRVFSQHLAGQFRHLYRRIITSYKFAFFFGFFDISIAKLERFCENEVMDITLKHPRASRIRANLILSIGSKKERKDVRA